MRLALITVLTLTFAGPAPANDPDGNTPRGFVALGDGGEFAAGSFPHSADWLALHCDGNQCDLRATLPVIGRGAARNVLDEDEPTDVVHIGGQPIAMFSGVPGLSNPVTTWGRDPGIVSAAASTAMAGEFDLPLGVTGLRWQWQRSDDGQTYSHQLSDGQRSQNLFDLSAEGHYGGDTSTPQLHWIGDLDADGKVDLLLSLPDDNCGYDQRLYLSSRAKDGEWLGLAARFEGHWPACGC